MIADPKAQDACRLPLASSRFALTALRLPLGAWLPLAVLGAYWLSLIHQLGAQWSIYEQYNYGWSVPFLCAYLVWRKVQDAKGEAQGAKRKAQSARRFPWSRSPVVQWSRSLFAVPWSGSLVVFLALLYAPTRWLHEANPVWRVTSLLWTLEIIGITFLVLHLLAEANAQKPLPASLFPLPSPPSSLPPPRFRVPSAFSLAFPICFFLVAVPWPYPLETFLVQTLTRLNVGATLELLGWSGVPAIQHGNVIEISTGAVGIDEACSGIRSTQATLMLSLFLGELYELTVRRRLWCVFAGFALAFVFNVGRTLLLTQVGQAHGIRAIAAWHDPAGVTILVACFLCLWGLAVVLRGPRPLSGEGTWKMEIGGRRSEDGDRRAEGRGPLTSDIRPLTSDLPSPISGASPVVPWSRSLVVSSSLAAWLVLVEGGTQLWYHLHERPTSATVNWSLQVPSGTASYQTLDISEAIRSQFRYDAGLEGEWQDPTGARWQLYYFRWLPTASLNRRVRVQRAKMHGPTTCLPMLGITLKADLGTTVIPIHSAPPRQAVKVEQTILSASAPPTPQPQARSALQPATLNLAIHQYEFQAEGRLLHVFYGIYEDQTGSAVLANRRLGSLSRLRAAADGSRNSGQRFLEAAVWGYDQAQDARAAFGRELEKLLKLQE